MLLLDQTELYVHQIERVIGIEPTSSAWKADALAVVLYPQLYFCFPWDQPKVQKLKPVGFFGQEFGPHNLVDYAGLKPAPSAI